MYTLLKEPWEETARYGGYNPEFVRKARMARDARLRAEQVTASLPAARRMLLENGAPEWTFPLLAEVANEYQVTAVLIMSACQKRFAATARSAFVYRLKQAKPELSSPEIGRWLRMHHTSVLGCLARHAEATGLPPLTTYNLHKARATNRATMQARREKEG